MADHPESVEEAVQALLNKFAKDLSQPGVLSNVIRQVLSSLPPEAQVHGAALVVAYAQGEHLHVLNSIDVWSLGGARGVILGLEAALEKATQAEGAASNLPEA